MFDADLEKFIDLEKTDFVRGLAVLAQTKPATSTIDR